MKRVILALTDRQAQALKEMAEVYLVKGGPAWDCMQCWDEPFEASDLEALNDVIQKSIEAPTERGIELLNDALDVVDDGDAPDNLGCTEEEWLAARALVARPTA